MNKDLIQKVQQGTGYICNTMKEEDLPLLRQVSKICFPESKPVVGLWRFYKVDTAFPGNWVGCDSAPEGITLIPLHQFFEEEKPRQQGEQLQWEKASERIPIMTHPLSKVWKQPSAENMVISDKEVRLKKKDFELLSEYSTTIPSGVYEGKMWKRVHNDKVYLAWYGASEEPNKCSVNHCEIGDWLPENSTAEDFLKALTVKEEAPLLEVRDKEEEEIKWLKEIIAYVSKIEGKVIKVSSPVKSGCYVKFESGNSYTISFQKSNEVTMDSTPQAASNETPVKEELCTCGVPKQIHGATCLGWGNASPVIFPFETCIPAYISEDEKKRRWECRNNPEAFRAGTIFCDQQEIQLSSIVKEEGKRTLSETMEELQNSPLGDAWGKVKCVCDALLRDSCNLNCPEHSDNKISTSTPDSREEGEDWKSKVLFYRHQTERIRSYINEKNLGKPCQNLFDIIFEELNSREEEKELILINALNSIIEMNLQTAQDQYGDRNKAESWACVLTARTALKAISKLEKQNQ